MCLKTVYFYLKDCGADRQQNDGLETAHGHPPTIVGPSIVGGGVGGSVPIRPPPPTSPSQQVITNPQQGLRSPLPYKQYGPIIPSEIGRAGVAPLQPNNTPINNSQQKNSSTPQNSVNPNSHPTISLVNNNQLRPSPTGNGQTPVTPRLALNSGTSGKGDISPTRVRQSTPSPKFERYSNMNTSERKQQTRLIPSTNETSIRQGASSTKQHSPNSNPNYQNKPILNANNSPIDQQPTIKRPRKGSGGVHAKQQHSQQSPHHGTNHKDVVSI